MHCAEDSIAGTTSVKRSLASFWAQGIQESDLDILVPCSLAGPRLWEPAAQTRKSVVDLQLLKSYKPQRACNCSDWRHAWQKHLSWTSQTFLWSEASSHQPVGNFELLQRLKLKCQVFPAVLAVTQYVAWRSLGLPVHRKAVGDVGFHAAAAGGKIRGMTPSWMWNIRSFEKCFMAPGPESETSKLKVWFGSEALYWSLKRSEMVETGGPRRRLARVGAIFYIIFKIRQDAVASYLTALWRRSRKVVDLLRDVKLKGMLKGKLS